MSRTIPFRKQDPDSDRFDYYQHPEEDLTKIPKFGHVNFMSYKSNLNKLKDGIWPWTEGIRGRLPEHYKARYLEKYTTTPIPVHYIPDERQWAQDKYGVWREVENVPLPIMFPKVADKGLWGGEGLIVGWRKKKDKMIKPKTPRIWKPKLIRRVFYSEILDEHMAITCTLRLLDLVDAAVGFDHYILGTHEVDIHSALGMCLKRQMLTVLDQKSLYPNNPDLQEKVYNKYKKYMVSPEEIPWIGLSIDEAVQMQTAIEERVQEEAKVPLKHMLAEAFIHKLQNPTEDEMEELGLGGKRWIDKLNPFQKNKD